MIRIRYAWSSLRVLPYLLGLAAVVYLVASARWRPGSPWVLLALVYPLVLTIQRLTTVEFLLGERWMRIPGPHAWYEAVVPFGGWGFFPRDEPKYSEGRLVRLADVASWRSTAEGVEIRMGDGSARFAPFHGLRPRDARRVVEYLDSRLGDRRAPAG